MHIQSFSFAPYLYKRTHRQRQKMSGALSKSCLTRGTAKNPTRNMNGKCAAWISFHTRAQSYFVSCMKRLAVFLVKLLYAVAYAARVRLPTPRTLHSTSPKAWEQRPAFLPDRYVKEPCPSREEQRYNTISPRLNQVRRERQLGGWLRLCVCQLSANATFLIPWISPGSSFVNAKHFVPRSFSDAPTRYKSLSSTIRNLS